MLNYGQMDDATLTYIVLSLFELDFSEISQSIIQGGEGVFISCGHSIFFLGNILIGNKQLLLLFIYLFFFPKGCFYLVSLPIF